MIYKNFCNCIHIFQEMEKSNLKIEFSFINQHYIVFVVHVVLCICLCYSSKNRIFIIRSQFKYLFTKQEMTEGHTSKINHTASSSSQQYKVSTSILQNMQLHATRNSHTYKYIIYQYMHNTQKNIYKCSFIASFLFSFSSMNVSKTCSFIFPSSSSLQMMNLFKNS